MQFTPPRRIRLPLQKQTSSKEAHSFRYEECQKRNTTGKEHNKKINTTGNRIFKGIDNLKQDKNINIRVNGEMRAAFIKAAHDNGKNGTSLIRDFMQRYINENKSTKF